MSEEFLLYLWKYRKLVPEKLLTSDGQPIVVLKTGEQNINAGPDFFNAQIKIGITRWAGNVEIHLKSSDWNKHKHNTDKAYDNVILHVVYENDVPIYRKNGERIPVVTIKGSFDEELYIKYRQLISNKNWIPCEKLLSAVDPFIVSQWLSRLMIERLENKYTTMAELLAINKNNIEETFYQALGRNFGFNLNSLPFEMLARSLPQRILAKHKDSLYQIEALLFGQAGLLDEELKDDYNISLRKEYFYLKKKYQLQSIEKQVWKFLRLRPSGFPTIRIAQFADLIYHSQGLFSAVMECKTMADLRKLFDVKASEYWNSHHHFGKSSAYKEKKLGSASVDLLLINTVVPFLFIYCKTKGEEKYGKRALKFLEQLKPEKNSIITHWQSIGLNADAAFQSQALLELKKNYCNNKRCLNCGIGIKIL